MPVAAAVNALVGRVLDGLDAGVRARCNRAGILFALDDLGCASTLADLREMLAFDAASVKAAIDDAAPGFFFLRLKQATAASAEDAGGSAAALAAGSEQPVYADTTTTTDYATASAGAAAMAVDVPLVVSIKYNGKVLAERTSLLVSPATARPC